ncbi:glycosyltransferase family 2 protein [Aestuariivirga sp.]|uniref:glycosyltransferase family 2 protein n=1 Tax=Aestuariivirga sp. TaxID=2650926 RepID=UPI003593E0DB
MDERPDMSVVVVCFRMERELPRTLLSLARPYQKLDPALRHEVIVIDNGSDRCPTAEDFASLNLDLTIRRCSIRSPSPVFALNEGLALARGDLIGAWIDGARLASPGLLAAVHAAAAGHDCPVIAPLNWQIGPQRQHFASATGYDQAEEDRIIANSGWPETPYRLFAASTCETQPGPSGPLLESNALFLRRTAWDRLGGYDTAFDEAGGGVANPDTLIRAAGLPGARLIRIVDEGTFHQFHGGVSTSDTLAATTEVQRASRKYYRLRGKPLQPLREPGILYRSHASQPESQSA